MLENSSGLEADAEVSRKVMPVLRGWCQENHRQTYDRIIFALGYDPDDVYELRLTETAIEVAVVDFDDVDWPLVRRCHPLGNETTSE
jgi:hypothetical protein